MLCCTILIQLVPIVNPDGVYHGCYRTDTRGQNLNRYYLGTPNKVGRRHRQPPHVIHL